MNRRPLRSTMGRGMGPKRFYVVVEHKWPNGKTGTLTVDAKLQLGGIPDGASSKLQARKLLPKVRAIHPTARIIHHRAM